MENAIKMQRHLDKITETHNKKRRFDEMVEEVNSAQQTTLIPNYF